MQQCLEQIRVHVLTQIWYAWVVLERDAVHVIPQFAPVVPIGEQLPQPVKGLSGAPTEEGPGLGKPVDRGALQRAQHRKLAVQIVQLVQFLGELDKVRHHVGASAGVLVL